MTEPTPDSDPYALFNAWLAEAEAAEPNDPNAMCLATTTPDAMPSARMVLLKGLDARGFVFFTNHDSRKGEQLLANPQAALNFHWKSLRRVVRVEGRVEQVSAAESDEYYATRPRLSRIGAWASRQSRPLGSRAELEAAVAEVEARFPGAEVPRPPNWGGFRVLPARIEFWRDMPFRLHDRRVFHAQPDGGWRSETLYP
ncbi:pyridoxamine 5'-phosphate oxidase [Roseomonas marmotae]|uniref:Pyridoxine/pyridoxamine 5'-phosphate oxidase n=1 Tax=Roseomonas marmotae TaxID=2768161 RepID=A0ABS3KB67_9PROT|nr:pyridoxamine 5'-phosphate oxidase [Roseomonas marmotae]MBO1074237.1 pyridoxamine 5'-phosphate oxidase [Roseomonas marmotae]QTI79000.1 pyridoxamine 5'-phosphate oxidase [Roseomonas marmotae]